MLIPWWIWVNSVVFYLLTNAKKCFLLQKKKKKKEHYRQTNENMFMVQCNPFSETPYETQTKLHLSIFSL